MSQNQQISRNGAELLRISVIKRTLVIMAIALTLIGVLSFELTRSIRLLTKRVQQMSSKDILANTTSQSLTEMVTTPQDHEIYSLELAYNEMLERLRNSTISELSLRESTLHAQLNALQTQINPHFIYNTLNIISAKSIESENFDIIEICDQFASMLRYSTDTHSRIAEIEARRSSLEESNQHIGLINTCLRLYYYSKGNIRISIRNDNGAVITINIPQNPTF